MLYIIIVLVEVMQFSLKSIMTSYFQNYTSVLGVCVCVRVCVRACTHSMYMLCVYAMCLYVCVFHSYKSHDMAVYPSLDDFMSVNPFHCYSDLIT